MNSKVFERAMFKAESKPTKATSGITQGFDDEYEEEGPESDEMAEEVSKRTPSSPEILMNNLRGDMRSVDARYQELAEMVGEDVAMETPPEVLAMLQSQLGAQAAPAGIGALPTQGVPPPLPPGGAPMPTPPEMGGMPPAPPQMPQGPMPTAQGPAPQGFAYGGMVDSAPGYGPMSMMAPPMYQGAMAPQGYAQGGEVGNPAQGIQQFKGGGIVRQILDPNNPNNPVQRITNGKRPGGVSPAGVGSMGTAVANAIAPTAEMVARQKAEEERKAAEELQAKRDKIFSTPTVKGEGASFATANPEFVQEFARRFQAGNQQRNYQPYFTQSAPAFGAQGAPVYQNLAFNPMQQNIPRFGFASGGVVDIPQAGANYNSGVSYSGPLEAGANYIQGAGRNGDTMLAHMKPEQHQVLSMMGGGSTTNPKTGLPEHYLGVGMATNLMQRIQPYAQAANQYIGSRMAPVLTPPTMQQSRSTLGTFGPRTVEGMELTYPSLTQRIGAATEPARNYIANMPGYQKAGAALATIPGGKMVMDAFGAGETVPNMPPSDVPAVIGTDEAGRRTYTSPPIAPVPEAKMPEVEQTEVQQVMAPPTAPKTEAELIEKQGKKDKLENRLDAYMKENLPVFEKYMGGDKEASQIQALFLLADAGLEYATKPARSGAMALANAFKRLPAGLSQITAQEEARKSQIRGAALTSGLQTIAAEDKATAALQRELLKKAVSSGEVVPTDRGAGLTSYVDKQGQDKGMRLDPQVANSFLNSRFTPQVQKDKEGNVVGFNTPYARVSEGSQTINLDKSTRERLANEVSRQEAALAAIDDVIKEYSGAFGPKAFFSNLKNNVLVPVSPLDPNVMTEQQRTKINMAINIATKAIAKTGDTGNIAVAEQNAASSILGDKPGTFFSDSQGALKRMMTVRTSLANQRLNTAAQLGWINQDVQLDVPNLGTPADPIPQDKLGYLTSLKQVNPNAQVYININGKSTPVLLSTLKD